MSATFARRGACMDVARLKAPVARVQVLRGVELDPERYTPWLREQLALLAGKLAAFAGAACDDRAAHAPALAPQLQPT